MRTILLYILITILLFDAKAGKAQGSQDTIQLRIAEKEIVFRNDSVQIHLNIHANNVHINPEQVLELEFFLELDNRIQALPAITYEGSRYSRFDKRNELLSYDYVAPPYHTYSDAQKNESYSIEYKVGVPYASWMDSCALTIQQAIKDCCNEPQLLKTTLSNNINIKKKVVKIVEKVEVAELGAQAKVNDKSSYPLYKDVVLFLEPEEKSWLINTLATSQRSTEFSTVIMYPLEGYTIQSQLGNNARNLFKIDSLFRSIEKNPDVRLNKVEIAAYTSPEGTYHYNKTLASNRAAELKSYLRRHYKLANSVFKATAVGEDWNELKRLVENTQMLHKNEVLSIINTVGIFNGREKMLMELAGGDPYKEMQQNLFPSLRRIELKIYYSSATGSNSCQQASNLLPNDIVANNNAAAVALLNGDTKKARLYMKRIEADPRSYVNWGVIHYMEGNITRAEEYFRKAYGYNEIKHKAITGLRLLTEQKKK